MEQIRHVKIRRRNSVEPMKNTGPHIDPESVKRHICVVGVVGVVLGRSRRLKPILSFAIFVFSIISR